MKDWAAVARSTDFASTAYDIRGVWCFVGVNGYHISSYVHTRVVLRPVKLGKSGASWVFGLGTVIFALKPQISRLARLPLWHVNNRTQETATIVPIAKNPMVTPSLMEPRTPETRR
jgi:hypothetical protein